jgi:hypothetical protein
MEREHQEGLLVAAEYKTTEKVGGGGGRRIIIYLKMVSSFLLSPEILNCNTRVY